MSHIARRRLPRARSRRLLCSLLVVGVARRTAVHACCTFGNYGWLAFGVTQVLLGEPGLRRAVFFCLLWWPIFYGFGLLVGLIHARCERKRLPLRQVANLVVPVIASMSAGLVFNLKGWKLPPLVETTLEPFGAMAVPLSIT